MLEYVGERRENLRQRTFIDFGLTTGKAAVYLQGFLGFIASPSQLTEVAQHIDEVCSNSSDIRLVEKGPSIRQLQKKS